MLYVSCDLKPYMCFDFQNLSIYDLYMYSIGPKPKFFDYRLFRQFLNFLELPRQFKSDMSSLLAQAYPGIGLLAI
jgi:hypothetical protein